MTYKYNNIVLFHVAKSGNNKNKNKKTSETV